RRTGSYRHHEGTDPGRRQDSVDESERQLRGATRTDIGRVRSSWLSTGRNSSFIRSTAWRSVMSRNTTTAARDLTALDEGAAVNSAARRWAGQIGGVGDVYAAALLHRRTHPVFGPAHKVRVRPADEPLRG